MLRGSRISTPVLMFMHQAVLNTEEAPSPSPCFLTAFSALRLNERMRFFYCKVLHCLLFCFVYIDCLSTHGWVHATAVMCGLSSVQHLLTTGLPSHSSHISVPGSGTGTRAYLLVQYLGLSMKNIWTLERLSWQRTLFPCPMSICDKEIMYCTEL